MLASPQKYLCILFLYVLVLLIVLSPQEPSLWLPLLALVVGVALATIRDIFAHLLVGDLVLLPKVLLEGALRGVLAV